MDLKSRFNCQLKRLKLDQEPSSCGSSGVVALGLHFASRVWWLEGTLVWNLVFFFRSVFSSPQV